MFETRHVVNLRPKNQITLPAEIVKHLDARPGDRLIVEVDNEYPERIQLRAVRRSYAGILEGMFGSPEEELDYVREERAAWGQQTAIVLTVQFSPASACSLIRRR